MSFYYPNENNINKCCRGVPANTLKPCLTVPANWSSLGPSAASTTSISRFGDRGRSSKSALDGRCGRMELWSIWT